MTESSETIRLTSAQFERIGSLVHGQCGIRLDAGKEDLVKSRLMKRLRSLSLRSYDEYLSRVEKDESELLTLLDCITTNKTDFFREPRHFEFLGRRVMPELNGDRDGNGRIRIWSAASSSGEEPYSIAIWLLENCQDLAMRDARILATDISRAVLSRARRGVYSGQTLAGVKPPLLAKYFTRTEGDGEYRVNDSVRRFVDFARLNLMNDWPMKGPFDVVFCRNVMIYFDRETEERLVNRMKRLLKPGGYLFTGHSESLTGIDHGMEYVQPAVYRKSS